MRYFARHAPSRAIDYLAALEDVEVTPAPPLACRVELPGSTFQYRHYNRLGALNFYAFLLGGQVPEADAWRAAVDWRDDQLFVYFDPEPKTVAMTWRLRFATRATAELTVQAAQDLADAARRAARQRRGDRRQRRVPGRLAGRREVRPVALYIRGLRSSTMPSRSMRR